MSNIIQIKNDFRNFLFLTWQHLGLPDPTYIQYDQANFLQDTNNPRILLEAFRGVGKSWITSAFVLWRFLNNPEEKFLVVSASKTRADDFSVFTQRLISEMPILQHLQPKKETQRYSKVAFDVGPAKASHSPSVKSVGIMGQLTGSRATTIIADDIEVPSNSATQDLREQLIKRIGEFESVIAPTNAKNPFIGRIIFLGTPQSEESIYNKLRDKGYTTRIWPARYPSTAMLEKYNNCLAPMIEQVCETKPEAIGESTEPTRFNNIDLEKREISMGKSMFNLQFMLDTSLSDLEKYPLKTSDFIVLDIDLASNIAPLNIVYGSSKDCVILDDPNMPRVGFAGDRWHRPLHYDKEKWTPFEFSLIAIDPSGRGTDETAYVVIKQLLGKLFIVDSGGMKGGYDDATLKALARKCLDHKVNRVLIEANYGDGMFSQLFKPHLYAIHKCSVDEVKNYIQKEKRIIDTLEPLLNQHRLVVSADVVRKDLAALKDTNSMNYSLFYQLTRITRTRGALVNDDRLDVLAMGCNYFVEELSRSTDDAIKMFKERELDKQLKDFLKLAGGKTKAKTWGHRGIGGR